MLASGGRLARSVTPPVASCEFGCRLGIADLAPGTLYSVELAAVTGAGCRGGAAALSVVTLPAPPCNSTDDTGAPAPTWAAEGEVATAQTAPALCRPRQLTRRRY